MRNAATQRELEDAFGYVETPDQLAAIENDSKKWGTQGGDIYGNSPGMEALGDVNQLQHQQLRKAQGIDYKTNPPLQAPTALAGRPAVALAAHGKTAGLAREVGFPALPPG